MTDVLTKEQRSYNMSRIRSKNTLPEERLKKALRKSGITGFRSNYSILGKPDITFPTEKIALFVDGCFWHGCPSCYKKPKTNEKFWLKKIKTNKKRDKFVNKMLAEKGWKIIRIWEHEIIHSKNILTDANILKGFE